jgi:nitrile hydratase accessory protein
VKDRERVLDARGPAAPPRRNGELVFDAPWESRVFGITMALYEQGRFEWDEFRGRLIAAIGREEREHPAGAPFPYYACWLAALEELLAAKGMCAAAALRERAGELAARPAGHDHR